MHVTGQRANRTLAAPAVLARVVLIAVVAANALVVEVLFIRYGAGKNAILTLANFLGLHATLIMMLQLTLVARLPWLDRRIGMDRLTSWHRWVGFTLVWTVLVHATIAVLGFAVLAKTSFVNEFVTLAGVTATLLGMSAATIIVVVAVTSIRYARRRLSYETWHGIHFFLYAAILLAMLHQLREGTLFTTSTFARAYWWTMWACVLTMLVVGRFVLPLWRNAYHRFRVAEVVPEADNVVSIRVTGRHLDRLPARPGQFFIWRFLGHNRWWQANPFSLSAAPDGRSLRLTAKAVGSTSAGLRQVPVGTRVFAEGPYGAFTALHQTCDAMLLIAGGVGITPIRSLLESATGPVTVLYRVHNAAEAVLLPEVQALAAGSNAEVHLLTGRTGAGSPPNQPFAPGNLIALVPDIHRRDIYVCGPPAMTGAVLRALRELKVPKTQVHAERFSLAG
jgi:predicted ferric reductase